MKRHKLTRKEFFSLPKDEIFALLRFLFPDGMSLLDFVNFVDSIAPPTPDPKPKHVDPKPKHVPDPLWNWSAVESWYFRKTGTLLPYFK